MRQRFVSITSRRARLWWVLVPLLAYAFALVADRGWPVWFGPGFPKVDGDRSVPAVEATFFIYSPDARTMHLRTSLFVAEPEKLPPLRVARTNGGAGDASVTTTRSDGQSGLEAEMPLRLTRGTNTIRLTVGPPDAGPTAFLVGSVRVTRAIFDAGGLRFGLALAAVAAASILAARALGAGGLDQFGAATLIGFLLVTSAATVLSFFHLLTGGVWASVLIGVSLALGGWSARRLATHPPPAPAPANVLRPLEAVVLLAAACPAFVMHILLPISYWDDLMYHAPRAAYWMENASALPFVSHNDRLSVFPMGGDLLFACGTILSGAEGPGKFLGSLALPLTLFTLFALLKSARVHAGIALGVVLVFATTPRVVYSAIEIKPDLWLALLGITSLHWVLAARRGGSTVSPDVAACLAAAGVGAAFGIKWTAVPLLLLLPLTVWPLDWRRHPARVLPPTAAFAFALALGGAGPILVFNLWNSHHPFGPAGMRQLHQPDPGAHPMAVQFKRLPFLLFAPPYLPTAEVRDTVARWELAAAEAVGATEVLPREEGSPQSPGRFAPSVRQVDDKFSLGWDFVLVGVVVGLCCFRRRGAVEWRGDFLLVSASCLIFAVMVVALTRWQVGPRVPERFLVPAYAFGLVAASWPVNWLLAGRRVAIGLFGVLVLVHAIPYGVTSLYAFYYGEDHGWKVPENARTTSELDDVARLLPPGRTILLLADPGCRDYPLFHAREGFANRVLPWGKAAYDPAAFDQALRRPGVDTVVIVSPDVIDLLWDPPLDPKPFIQDMDSRAEFTRLPGTGKIVVYTRRN